MHFKTRAEHVLAALKQIEDSVEESVTRDFGTINAQLQGEIFNRRLNHAVQLFCADQLSDELRPHDDD